MLKQNIKKGEEMKEFFNKILRIKGIPYIMLALTVGIILIVISGKQSDTLKQGSISNSEGASKNDQKFSFSEYEDVLEKRLAEMISKISGSSSVSVMVVIESSYKSDIAERNGNYTLIRTENGEQAGLVLSETAPTVRGVAVICSNGDDPTIQKKIITMLSSLLNIPTAHIFVGS